MSDPFSTMIKNDALNMIRGLGGEHCVYTRNNGATRSIWVIVNRNPPSTYTANGELYTPSMTITAVNDPTDGIDTATMDPSGADTLTVAERVNGTTHAFGIYLPPPGSKRTNDAGMISLDLR